MSRKKKNSIARTHFNWRSYGAGSGRYSCRLQSCPRAEYLLDKSIVLETRVREVYVAKPGYKFVYYDLCFATGTLVDGPTGPKPIEKMRIGDLVYTYRAETRRPAVGRVNQHIRVGRHPVLKVTLDNGETVRCTPEHKWIVIPSGRRKHKKGPIPRGAPVDRLARDLKPDDRLLPLRKQIIGGREHLYSHDAFTYSKTHVETAAAAYGLRPDGCDVHHLDENPLNNSPDNLEYKDSFEHKSDHGKEGARRQWANPVIRAKMTAGLRRAAKTQPGWCAGENNPRFGDRRRRVTQPCAACGKPVESFASQNRRFCDKTCYGAARRDGLNHKVVSVESDGFADVWSIGVDPDRNYALAAGVFVRNSQAEMRVAAYASGDANFMKTCEGDVHSGNAQILFPSHAELIAAEPKGRGKPFRDVAKNAGFGVTYLAETETVFQFLRSKGFDVHFKDVAVMMENMHDAYADYFRYVNGNVQLVAQTGHMRSVLAGRIKWLGWHCPPTEVANYSIQPTIADLMNDRLPKINVSGRKLGAVLVAQVHDAAFFETPDKKVDEMKQIIADAWRVPIVVPANGRYGGSLKPEDGARSFVMPIDLKVAERWSEL